MCLKLADAGGKGNTQLIYMNNFDKIIDKIAAETDEKIAAVRAKAEREISEHNEGCENKINDMRRMNGERIERECAMIASRAESAASCVFDQTCYRVRYRYRGIAVGVVYRIDMTVCRSFFKVQLAADTVLFKQFGKSAALLPTEVILCGSRDKARRKTAEIGK